MTDSVKEELLKATGLKPDGKESINKLKLSLLQATDDISDEAFEKLSGAAQNWVSSAITAVNDSKSEFIEDVNFPPFPEESRLERESDPDVLDSPDSGKRIRQRRRPVMSRKPKEGIQWDMKRIIWQNENITWLALKNELIKRGYKPSDSMCKTILANVRQTIKAGMAEGKIRRNT